MRLKKADNLQNDNNSNNSIDNKDAVKDALELLNRIVKSCKNIKDDYYILLDNLNAIYSSYPNLYNEIKQIVKLPTDADIKDISELTNSMKTSVEKYLSNPDFLKDIIKR